MFPLNVLAQCTASITYQYDSTGKLARTLSTGADNSIQSEVLYFYSDTLLRKKEEYVKNSSGGQGVFLGKIEYTYSGGRLLKQTDYNSDSLLVKETLFQYDTTANLIKKKTDWIDSTGKRHTYEDNYKYKSGFITDIFSGSKRIMYRYDDYDRISREMRYEGGRNTGSYAEFEYDTSGRRTRMTEYTEYEGGYSPSYYVEYTYDSAGRLISECTKQAKRK